MKLAQWFWRRRFLNFVNVYSLFHNYLPLEKGVAFIRRNLNPFHPRMLCAKFGWFRKRRCICKKFKDRRTTGDQKSSPGELKSKYPFYYTPDTLRNKISFLKLHGDTNMQLVTWCKSVIVDKINVTCWTCCWFSAEGSICSGDRHTIKDINNSFLFYLKNPRLHQSMCMSFELSNVIAHWSDDHGDRTFSLRKKNFFEKLEHYIIM